MKVKIKVKTETKGFLNVGMGPTIDLSIDNPFNRIVKDDEETIFIPGSTVKGVLRKNALSIIHTIPNAAPSKINELFGVSGSHHGKLWVRSVKINPSNIELLVLSRIRIDIETNRAVKKALFTEEVIPPMSNLDFTLELYSKDPIDLEIVLAAIKELNYQRFGKGGSIEVKCVSLEGEVPSNIYEILSRYNLHICDGGENE